MKNLSRPLLLILSALILGLTPASHAGPADRYAAIAYSPELNRWGWGTNYATQAEAIARALSECGRSDARTSWCRNAWIALAISDKTPGGFGTAWGATPAAAREAALHECLARNPDARIVACVSAYGD
jgi:hypothetical protein